MTADPTGQEDWASAADLIGVVVARLADAVPVLARIAADVERDWSDERGRLWGERAALVRRTLQHELDAVLGAARLVGTAMGDTGASPGSARGPEDGEVPITPAAAGRRGGGPRLGGTGGQRVDDERGMRIAQLGDG